MFIVGCTKITEINNMTNNITTIYNNAITQTLPFNYTYCIIGNTTTINISMDKEYKLSLIKQIQYLQRTLSYYNESNQSIKFINLSKEYNKLEINYTQCIEDLNNLTDDCWIK